VQDIIGQNGAFEKKADSNKLFAGACRGFVF